MEVGPCLIVASKLRLPLWWNTRCYSTLRLLNERHWIPAFAGMTVNKSSRALWSTVIYALQLTNNYVNTFDIRRKERLKMLGFASSAPTDYDAIQ
jgi:hypothetical protein